jgi:hypothetical protein
MELKENQYNKLMLELDTLTETYAKRYKNKELFLINYVRNLQLTNDYERIIFMTRVYQGSLKAKLTWQKFLKSKKYEFDDPETATVFY